jgi:hypothetical protein
MMAVVRLSLLVLQGQGRQNGEVSPLGTSNGTRAIKHEPRAMIGVP